MTHIGQKLAFGHIGHFRLQGHLIGMLDGLLQSLIGLFKLFLGPFQFCFILFAPGNINKGFQEQGLTVQFGLHDGLQNRNFSSVLQPEDTFRIIHCLLLIENRTGVLG